MIGKMPSNANDPRIAGETMPFSEEICASCVPAFTNTAVPASMPNWLTQ